LQAAATTKYTLRLYFSGKVPIEIQFFPTFLIWTTRPFAKADATDSIVKEHPQPKTHVFGRTAPSRHISYVAHHFASVNQHLHNYFYNHSLVALALTASRSFNLKSQILKFEICRPDPNEPISVWHAIPHLKTAARPLALKTFRPHCRFLPRASVLECGSPLPLFEGDIPPVPVLKNALNFEELLAA
jgi:hypothetical protein